VQFAILSQFTTGDAALPLNLPVAPIWRAGAGATGAARPSSRFCSALERAALRAAPRALTPASQIGAAG